MSANSKKSVGSSNTVILVKNLNRKIAVFTNDSDQDIYMSLGVTAVMNKGIRLNAGGGLYEINASNMFRGTIYAICSSGGKNLSMMETTKEDD